MDWKRIKAEYIAGGTSYRKLADKYEVKFSALRNVAEKENWVELKAQAQHKSDIGLVDAVSAKGVKKAVNIIDVADKLLKKIGALADIVGDADSIKKLTSAIKDLKDIKGIKSEADMREQEARIKALEEQSKKSKEIPEIKVVFGEEGEDLAQ